MDFRNASRNRRTIYDEQINCPMKGLFSHSHYIDARCVDYDKKKIEAAKMCRGPWKIDY